MALGKPSNQSTTYPTNEWGTKVPSNANDGDVNTESVTADSDNSPWWMVDMQELVHVSHINLRLHHWAYTDGRFYKNLMIKTRITDTDLWKLCAEFSDPPSRDLTFEFNDNRTARFLQVSKSSPQLYLVEVEIYGNVLGIGMFTLLSVRRTVYPIVSL